MKPKLSSSCMWIVLLPLIYVQDLIKFILFSECLHDCQKTATWKNGNKSTVGITGWLQEFSASYN